MEPYLNDDPALSAQAGALVRTAEIPAGPAPALLRIRLEGGPGEPLRAIAVASDGRGVDAETPEALEPARGRPLDREVLEEHLGRFGGTRFRLESLDASGVAPRVFLRFPLLHALRRALVLKLEAAGTERALSLRRSRRFDVHENAPPGPVHRPTRLAVSVGSPRAGEEALLAGASCVLVESLGLPGGHERQVEAWRLFLSRTRDVWVKLPSIVHDPSIDSRALEVLQREAPEAGVIAGHMGQIALARRAGMRVAADFHLNASNALTLGVLRDAGACRATLSLELEAREAARVADFAGAGIEVEVVVGGAVFSMLTRQDFGLEEGASFAAVSEHGHAYRFEAGGGITTLYEAREVVGAEALHLLAGKVDVVRLDLAHQGPEAVREIAGAYASVLEHMAAPVAAPAEVSAAVARAVEVHSRRSPSGTFAGHLLRGARTLDSSEE
ncbi:MAG TPA: DUF3656 domain-containing protein [Planctomycetota bacterium]|nr:DUF3656 domain-containing protein [Planctomycetota bacterium]